MKFIFFILFSLSLLPFHFARSAEKIDLKNLSENFQEMHRVQLEISRLLSLAQEPREEGKDSLVFSLDRTSKNQFKLTPFLKIQRALETQLGVSLKKNTAFKCDQYVVEFAKELQVVNIFESCFKKQKTLVAKIELQNSRQWKVSFIPSYWTEILGLGVAVFSQEVVCQIQQSSLRKVQSFQCQNWVQSFSPTRVYKFKDYVYKKDQDPLIELRGELLDSLYPLRKVSLRVPLAGRILWQEAEISPVIKSTPTPMNTPALVKTPVREPAPLMPPPGYSPENQNSQQPLAPQNSAAPQQPIEEDQPIAVPPEDYNHPDQIRHRR